MVLTSNDVRPANRGAVQREKELPMISKCVMRGGRVATRVLVVLAHICASLASSCCSAVSAVKHLAIDRVIPQKFRFRTLKFVRLLRRLNLCGIRFFSRFRYVSDVGRVARRGSISASDRKLSAALRWFRWCSAPIAVPMAVSCVVAPHALRSSRCR